MVQKFDYIPEEDLICLCCFDTNPESIYDR
jgi:hypothetical protein